MTKAEMIERIKNVPDIAKVFSYADHGQTPEQTNTINFTFDNVFIKDAEEIKWISDNDFINDHNEMYDHIKAVMIG